MEAVIEITRRKNGTVLLLPVKGGRVDLSGIALTLRETSLALRLPRATVHYAEQRALRKLAELLEGER